MAGDLAFLIGRWSVWVKGWTWEYEFHDDGVVHWRDVNSKEKGTGYWAPTSKLVNIGWKGSATHESWQRPLLPTRNNNTWFESTYFRGKYFIEKHADQEEIDKAYKASRDSLTAVSARLKRLQGAMSSGGGAGALTPFKRDIAVISYRLVVPADATSPVFASALARAIALIDRNIPLPNTITAARDRGLCATHDAFAWTTPTRMPPDTILCTSWFTSEADQKRDVVTHEYFHTVGLADVENVDTTDKALRNANTLAQIVAFINDRSRQIQADGAGRHNPPLPSP